MLSANGASTPLGRSRRQPPPVRRRRLRRPALRLRPAQLHRPGRDLGRVLPGAPRRRAAGRARGRRPDVAACCAPATTCGSTRRCPCWAAPCRTGTPTATCPGPWPTSPPRPSCGGCCRGRLLRRRHPTAGRGPEPADRRHPRRRPVTRRAPRADRAPRVRTGRAAVRRQPDGALRPPRPHAGRLGHRAAGPGGRGRHGTGGHSLRRPGPAPRLRRRGAGRPPLRRRHGRSARHPPLLHGDRARRRRRHPALGDGGRAGRRRRCPEPTSSSMP